MSEVIYMGEKNKKLSEKIEELSGEKITLCEQCGICTTSCPMADDMDITPAGIMRYSQMGDERVVDSEAIWVCASCFTCTVRCPRGIDLAKVAEALRELNLRKNVDHIDVNHLDEELNEMPAIAVVSALRKFTS